ncbi:MAG: FtsX-like permease family protein [Bacteroidales bacterium]|nr:FtsX-like permease family protein [Bacteroidales bacterium]
MDVSFFIASRLKFKGKMAAVCIAVSYLVIIIAVAVSSGFRTEIRNGLSAISGDVQITPVDMNFIGEESPIERYPAYMEHLLDLDGVDAVVPAVYRAGIVKSGDNIHGIMLKGIPEMDGGDGSAPVVSIPARLASLLSLEEGDEMLTYFVGGRVKVRKFHVGSIYHGIIDSEDKLIVYTGLSDMQRLNGWNDDQVSAFEVRLDDRMRTVSGMEDMAGEIGFIAYSYGSADEETVVASSAVQSYPQLFDWLNLIDFNVLFILVLMTIVAGFNMVSGLLIMLFENISTIGLLKALGMTDRAIAKVFLASASSIVLKGMAAGNLLAFAICALQGSLHVITLDPANYFVDFVPVHIDVMKILLADIVSFIVIMLLMTIPSLFISRIDPAKTVAVR